MKRKQHIGNESHGINMAWCGLFIGGMCMRIWVRDPHTVKVFHNVPGTTPINFDDPTLCRNCVQALKRAEREAAL